MVYETYRNWAKPTRRALIRYTIAYREGQLWETQSIFTQDVPIEISLGYGSRLRDSPHDMRHYRQLQFCNTFLEAIF